MPLTINTNMAATRASYYLSKNNDMLQKSLDRLSSGKRITQPADDAGGLAVSMKLQGTIDQLSGAENNVANGVSFLQVQDGILDSAAQIVSRMAELKGLYSDVLKSQSDKDTYDSEFQDLQGQLYQLAQTQFNGNAMFSETNGKVFDNATHESDESIKVYITENGTSGNSVEIHKSLLLSALSFDDADGTNNVAFNLVTKGLAKDTSAAASTDTLADTNFKTALINKALGNVAKLRANNGGQTSRLQFAQESIRVQKTNLEAANGRIMDVDIAAETAALAKHQILVQASATMVAQANSANNVALLLLQ